MRGIVTLYITESKLSQYGQILKKGLDHSEAQPASSPMSDTGQGSNQTVTPTLTLTISNIRRTILSDSPRYLEPRVEVEMLKKVVPHSVATALASMVFPVPGGPTIRTPWGGGGEIRWMGRGGSGWVDGEGRERVGGWGGEGVVGWVGRGGSG